VRRRGACFGGGAADMMDARCQCEHERPVRRPTSARRTPRRTEGRILISF
jgi:hypothetical protein